MLKIELFKTMPTVSVKDQGREVKEESSVFVSCQFCKNITLFFGQLTGFNFRLLPTIRLKEPIVGDEAHLLKESFSKGVIEIREIKGYILENYFMPIIFIFRRGGRRGRRCPPRHVQSEYFPT